MTATTAKRAETLIINERAYWRAPTDDDNDQCFGAPKTQMPP